VKDNKKGKTLAIQVTGVAGSFNQKDKHFGALMKYLPEHNEKIANGQAERIVLIVNTFRDTARENRNEKDDISVPVQELVRRNNICLIRSRDLYFLWKLWIESPGKLSREDIFKQLFDCKGIWQRGESGIEGV
jgi:hypothetical protein